MPCTIYPSFAQQTRGPLSWCGALKRVPTILTGVFSVAGSAEATVAPFAEAVRVQPAVCIIRVPEERLQEIERGVAEFQQRHGQVDPSSKNLALLAVELRIGTLFELTYLWRRMHHLHTDASAITQASRLRIRRTCL